MTDILAELRRLHEAAPQGQWTLKPFVDLRGRVIGYDIRTGPRRRDVIEVATRELGVLIVAMHNHLPTLLDIAEAFNEAVDPLDWDNTINQCPTCLLCSAAIQSLNDHDPNCPYLRAREICGMDGAS